MNAIKKNHRRVTTAMAVAALLGSLPALAEAAIRVTIRPVTLETPSASDTAATLPSSQTEFVPGETFHVELWAQTTETNGLSSVTVDLTFVNTVVNAQSITHTALFNALTTGTINNPGGLVDDLGGSHPAASPPCSDQVGLTNWARVAIVEMQAQANGSSLIQTADTGSSLFGTAICNEFGNVIAADIDFGQVTVTVEQCFDAGDCDDAQFCNGSETCVANVCQSGTAPSCDDSVACTDDSCDPAASGGAGACVNAANDANCDDGQFCNGAETCDPVLDCQSGAAVCTATCEHCDETANACELCILDLDLNGVMGTGDFAIFSGCFGACYLATDPCADSNFDDDPGICVGTGDYAGFAGCFGQVCADCANCAGPGSLEGELAATGTAARIRLVTRHDPTADESLAELPPSDLSYHVGQQVFVEVWATREITRADQGLAAVFVDLAYDSTALAVEDVQASAMLPIFAGGAMQPGVVTSVGGCARLGHADLGLYGEWIRVATIVARATSAGMVTVDALAADDAHGVSIVGDLGNISRDRIDFGKATFHVRQRPVEAERKTGRDGKRD